MTYRYFNPDGHRVEANYKHYQSLNLDASAYIPLETVPYRDLYIEGIDLYADEKWKEALEKFETSVNDFYTKLEECYIACEAFNFDDLSISEYQGILTNLYIALLQCRTECVNKLDFFRLDPADDLLSSHYEYLQFTYYKREELSQWWLWVVNDICS